MIQFTSYDPGEILFGDLDLYGWMVIRGVSKIAPKSNESHPGIDTILRIAEEEEEWFEEDNQRGRYMVYNHESDLHHDWESEEVKQLFKLVREKSSQSRFIKD